MMDDEWSAQGSYEEQEAFKAGRNMARALLNVFLPNPNMKMFHMNNLARKFARWDGFKSGDAAISYLSGFMEGYQSALPKQVNGPVEE